MPTRLSGSQSQTDWVLPLVGTYLTRAVLQDVLRAHGVRLYWRTLTPLVVVWGMLYQRLQSRATLDDVVSALHSGQADGLDPDDPHPQPLSQRLRSVSTSAYQQARQRVPVALIRALRERVRDAVLAEPAAWGPAGERTWHGHPVRWLDGTTLRLPPAGDLPDTYGRAAGKCGPSHWVTAQAVVSFCWATWLVVAHAESAHAPSETTLVRAVLADAPAGTLSIADRGFAIYRTVQVAAHLHQHVLVRLDARHVPPLLHRTGLPTVAQPTTEWPVCWAYRPHLACEADLPCPAVAGRVLYARLTRAGFRAQHLYLFTTLTDGQAYPVADLVALYASRWQVELRYRDLKTTLRLDYFDVRSAAMFAKELEVGLLAYTLIRVAMLDAAPSLPAAQRLAFATCRRRVRDAWARPGRGLHAPTHPRHFQRHLAACRLPRQAHKVPHEPRAVRRTPQVFPALKGPRQAARDATRTALGAISS